jgi:ABC-2 type transport system ATP-binding protein
MLSVRDLSVSYGAHQALSALSLDAASGTLIAVIGPNGAGKTTFIKALCGRVASTGTIAIDGHDLKRGADRRATIGLVPQDIGLYPHMTALENLSVMARLMGVPRSERQDAAAKALSAVGMDAKSAERVSHLSGGMKRRINVAAAIMHQPKVLIFDEPTAGVDIPARDVVHRLARTMAERGMVVLLVTHELEQAEALCDKVLLLAEGKRVDFEAPAALLERYFGDQRDIIVRFAGPPDDQARAAMTPFGFEEAELPTVFSARTLASEVSFVSAFMAAIRTADQTVREIVVRRPGLPALLHQIQAQQTSDQAA